MKGYRMVLLVNGGILLFVAVSAFMLANVMSPDADDCQAEKAKTCEQSRAFADNARNVSPYLLLLGVILLVLGLVLGRQAAPPDGL